MKSDFLVSSLVKTRFIHWNKFLQPGKSVHRWNLCFKSTLLSIQNGLLWLKHVTYKLESKRFYTTFYPTNETYVSNQKRLDKQQANNHIRTICSPTINYRLYLIVD